MKKSNDAKLIEETYKRIGEEKTILSTPLSESTQVDSGRPSSQISHRNSKYLISSLEFGTELNRRLENAMALYAPGKIFILEQSSSISDCMDYPKAF